MNIRKEFKIIVLPILKGMPITILLVVIAFMGTRRMVIYTNSIYQADGAIRIDTRDHGVNAAILFNEQSRGKSTYNFLTEVESFKSKILIENTLASLPFEITYFRVGKLKTTELYNNCPFVIDYSRSFEKAYDQKYYLKFLGQQQFLFSKNEEFINAKDTLSIGRLFVKDQLAITASENTDFITANPNGLKEGDIFQFQLNSTRALQETVNASNLFIKPIDKEIQVIKIYYQHEVPEKAELFVNALMKTYIESCQKKITSESETTLVFIDEQLSGIRTKLKSAESRLAGFKAENGIINSKQETDATLKEIMQLDLQRVNYKLQEEELIKLFDFLASGNNFQEFAPNFESLRDAVFRDAYLQVQGYELEKLDLEMKYTPESEEILTVNSKINNLRTFIHESVKTTLSNLTQRRTSLEENIASINESIKTLPNKERQIVVLEREVSLNESLYNLMMEKRMELAISKSASLVGHQIIDPARLAKAPIWPNKGLIYGVAIFFALLIGILLSFIGHFLFSTVKTKEDLTEVVSIPIIGTIGKCKKGSKNTINSLANLYTNLEIVKQKDLDSNEASIITMTSLLPNEGKTFTTVNLGKAFASVGKKVLIIDMDVRKPSIHESLKLPNNDGGLSAILKGDLKPKDAIQGTPIKNLDVISAGELEDVFSAIIFSPSSIEFISQLKAFYDYILIDTPPLNMVIDAIPLMHKSDLTLFIIRSGRSKIRKVKMIEPLLEEFKVPNVYTVLNGVKTKKQTYYRSYSDKNKGGGAIAEAVLEEF